MVGQLSSRVLVVDDEPLIRKVITSQLVAAGYVVRAAVDGLDALQKLRGGVPDLVISDIDMPRMSGIELLGVLRHRFPHIPVIAISAGSLPDNLQSGVGPDAYCQKSTRGFEGLLQSVARLTRESPCHAPEEQQEDDPVLARSDGEGHFVITCGECLRSFSVSRVLHVGRHDQWTTCVHCGSPVQFVTETPDSALLN